jgi:hypothetical protein
MPSSTDTSFPACFNQSLVPSLLPVVLCNILKVAPFLSNVRDTLQHSLSKQILDQCCPSRPSNTPKPSPNHTTIRTPTQPKPQTHPPAPPSKLPPLRPLASAAACAPGSAAACAHKTTAGTSAAAPGTACTPARQKHNTAQCSSTHFRSLHYAGICTHNKRSLVEPFMLGQGCKSCRAASHTPHTQDDHTRQYDAHTQTEHPSVQHTCKAP